VTQAAASELLTTFRRGFGPWAAAFNAGDFDRAALALSDDIEQRFPEEFPERSVRGRAAWVQFFQEYRRDLATWDVTLLESADAGSNQLIANVEYVGIGRASALRQTFRTWDLVRYDEHGRISLICNFADRAAAEEAAGLG
jgi:ketosteroid isomerase-like protein